MKEPSFLRFIYKSPPRPVNRSLRKKEWKEVSDSVNLKSATKQGLSAVLGG